MKWQAPQLRNVLPAYAKTLVICLSLVLLTTVGVVFAQESIIDTPIEEVIDPIVVDPNVEIETTAVRIVFSGPLSVLEARKAHIQKQIIQLQRQLDELNTPYREI